MRTQRQLKQGILKLTSGESGVGLVEVIVGVGVLGIVLSLGAKFFSKQTKLQAANRTRVAIFNTGQYIEQLLASKAILHISAAQPGNATLDRCMTPVTADCAESNSWIPFNLYNPESNDMVAGGPQQPVYHDSFGNICASSNLSDCAYSVTSEFMPRCFPGQNTCSTAQMIVVRYQIAVIPGTSNQKIRPLEVQREIDIGFASIWTRLKQSCPPGQAVRGISYAYELRCEGP